MKEIFLSKDKSKAVVSRLGGTVTAWNIAGQNILFPQQKLNVNDKNKLRGGIPVCSPWFGKADNYNPTLPAHGLLKNIMVTPVSNYNGTVYLVGVHNPTKDFPWQVFFTTKIILGLNKLTTEHTVERGIDGNTKAMPLNMGFHDYYQRNGFYQVKIKNNDGITLSEKKVIRTEMPAKHFVTKNQATVYLEKIGRVELTFQSNMSKSGHLLIWTDGIKYGCAEFLLDDTRNYHTANGIYLQQGKSSTIKLTRTFLAD